MNAINKLQELLQFDNWLQLITDRLFFRNTNVQVHRINGLEMIVDHRAADAGSIRGCIAGDMYRQMLKRMKLGRSLAVADFGANVGGFSCLLRVLELDVQHLMCVEMNPNTYERLRFNINSNYSISPNVINAAVCGVPREISLSLGIGSTGDNIYVGHHGTQTTSSVSIQGMTFDDLCDKYLPDVVIDICKMDIEGAEAEILSESSEFIRSLDRCRYFLIEMHPVESYDEMCRVLDQHEFQLIADEGKQKCGVHLFQNTNFN